MVGNLLRGLLENHTAHPSFEPLANLQVQFNNMAAVIVFFSWVKVKKIFFLYFIIHPGDLQGTLSGIYQCSRVD